MRRKAATFARSPLKILRSTFGRNMERPWLASCAIKSSRWESCDGTSSRSIVRTRWWSVHSVERSSQLRMHFKATLDRSIWVKLQLAIFVAKNAMTCMLMWVDLTMARSWSVPIAIRPSKRKMCWTATFKAFTLERNLSAKSARKKSVLTTLEDTWESSTRG